MLVPDHTGSPAREFIQPSASSQDPIVTELQEEEPEFQGSAMSMPSERTATALINKVFGGYRCSSDLSREAEFVHKTICTLDKQNTKLAKLLAAEKRFGRDYRHHHLQEMLDLLLHFLGTCLDDHKITATEIGALGELRELLDIREGDLYRERRDAVRRLLERQIDWMEDDFRISRSEEFYLVDLQRIFDLGYDQLLDLAQPHVAEILDNLHLQLSIVETPDLRIQIDQLMKTFCMLHYRPFELTKEDAGEVAGRMIPQSVKDAVWRRDGAKCAICGSHENLEFDHIIPFVLGGSNTYRNVQLLCQNCNRNKEARIG